MPGRLLASAGAAGWYLAVALLLCGGLAVGAWLVLRPPAGAVAAADRLAAGLCLAFLLAPAGRFGYFGLPLVLLLWTRRADPAHGIAARRPTLPVAFSARVRSPAHLLRVPHPRLKAAPSVSTTLVITNDFPPRQGGIETFVHEVVTRLPGDLVVYTSSEPGAAAFDRTLPFRVVRDPSGPCCPPPDDPARGATGPGPRLRPGVVRRGGPARLDGSGPAPCRCPPDRGHHARARDLVGTHARCAPAAAADRGQRGHRHLPR